MPRFYKAANYARALVVEVDIEEYGFSHLRVEKHLGGLVERAPDQFTPYVCSPTGWLYPRVLATKLWLAIQEQALPMLLEKKPMPTQTFDWIASSLHIKQMRQQAVYALARKALLFP